MILLRNFVLLDFTFFRSRLVVWFLWSYQSVPPNLAAGLDARRESDVMIVLKKGREVAIPLPAPE